MFDLYISIFFYLYIRNEYITYLHTHTHTHTHIYIYIYIYKQINSEIIGKGKTMLK